MSHLCRHMLHSDPTSHAFTYTTLFRSNMLAGLFKTLSYRRAEREAMDRAAWWLERLGLTDVANRTAGTLAYGQQRRLEIARCMVDRKSTRLNSSHVKISYAVFCLKKKN